MDGQNGNPTQPSQEKVLADFVSLLTSGDKSKEGVIQQKLEEIMKTGGMTHEAMFKVRHGIEIYLCCAPMHATRNFKQFKRNKRA
jgi:hypothetical protein